MRRASTYGDVRIAAPTPTQERFRERALAPLREAIARVRCCELNPKIDASSDRRLKLLVGRARPPGVADRLPRRQGRVAPSAGSSAACLVSSAAGSATGLLFAVALAPALGFIAPGLLRQRSRRARRERIRAELPDALDLLAVSVEAGLGFDGAIAKLTEHMDGPLADEFALTLSEMRIGESRQDALKKMAERVDAPEVASFVRAIIQADQLGISLGRILRVQAADTRLRRQAAAEERAMKAPIKMLFPTVLFIFPAMFLVILGPAFLNIEKVF